MNHSEDEQDRKDNVQVNELEQFNPLAAHSYDVSEEVEHVPATMGEGGEDENSQNILIDAEAEEGGKNALIPPPGGDGAEVDQFENKIEKMLSKIPPDWDLAEKHGLANLAYDPSKCTDPYDMDSDKFCHCCQH